MATVEAGAPTSPTTKLPAALTTSEKWWSALLVVLGTLLTIGVLVWFGLSTEDGGLKSKVTTVSEPVGEGATGTKTTTTTDYADTIVIFALTAGAAFILAGAFYGRLRELKLGGLALGLGELPPEKKQELDAKVDEQVKAEVADPTNRRSSRLPPCRSLGRTCVASSGAWFLPRRAGRSTTLRRPRAAGRSRRSAPEPPAHESRGSLAHGRERPRRAAERARLGRAARAGPWWCRAAPPAWTTSAGPAW